MTANPTGRSSVTARLIHTTGLPRQDRATMSPSDKHTESHSHHDGFETVKYIAVRTSMLDLTRFVLRVREFALFGAYWIHTVLAVPPSRGPHA